MDHFGSSYHQINQAFVNPKIFSLLIESPKFKMKPQYFEDICKRNYITSLQVFLESPTMVILYLYLKKIDF